MFVIICIERSNFPLPPVPCPLPLFAPSLQKSWRRSCQQLFIIFVSMTMRDCAGIEGRPTHGYSHHLYGAVVRPPVILYSHSSLKLAWLLKGATVRYTDNNVTSKTLPQTVIGVRSNYPVLLMCLDNVISPLSARGASGRN
jgi:hypothetical protein